MTVVRTRGDVFLLIGLTAAMGGVAGVAMANQPASSPAATEVVIGASISAGFHAPDGHAWPALVDRQFEEGGTPLRMVNASIGATRLLTSYPNLPSSLSREASDALAVPGVRGIVLTDVINDIQAEPHEYDADKIISGIREFTRVAHEDGVRVTVLTLTPYGGFATYESAGEQTRQAVNAAIRSGTLADAFVDADRVLADPADPTRIDPDLDSGDHLHPNGAGQEALADAVRAALVMPGG